MAPVSQTPPVEEKTLVINTNTNTLFTTTVLYITQYTVYCSTLCTVLYITQYTVLQYIVLCYI